MKVTDDIESIVIKNECADVILRNEDDLESVLILTDFDLMGNSVKIQKLSVNEDLSDPEILLVEDSPKIIPDIQEIYIEDKKQEKFTTDKNNTKIENSLQLRARLQEINLEHRREFPENDYFYMIMDTKVVVFVTMVTLIILTFSDILG